MHDMIESMEYAAEARLNEMTNGLPKGKFRCYCGEVANLKDATPSSDNPYSDPMCKKCARKK